MSNPVCWFEIATTDIERAKAFYTKVFKSKFKEMEVNGEKMFIFEADYSKSGSGGSLIESKELKPGVNGGTMIYFASEDVAIEAARVEAAGGKLLKPKTSLGGSGYIAEFLDTEGNKIGIYSS
ncbi:MAG: VOC family protein [Chitinophagales bacterium]